MRRLSMILMIITTASLISCVSVQRSPTRYASNLINRQTVTMITKDSYAAKNPEHIQLYAPSIKPQKPYRVIGVATVSKYNLIGKERQETTLNEMMKKIAASIGGDAIINIDSKGEVLHANIIQFRRILL